MVKMNLRNICCNPVVNGSFLIIALIISLFFYALADGKKRRVILYFPVDNRTEVHGDYHIIPLKESLEENMKALLAEAMLEPYDYRLNETVPSGTVINSFIYDKEKRIVYADLSREIAINDGNSPLANDGEMMLSILAKNLKFSFPKIEKVLFTIEGHVPYAPFFDYGSN